MDSATLDELRELQARAYGPSADIDQDPSALRRLRDLEAAQDGANSPSREGDLSLDGDLSSDGDIPAAASTPPPAPASVDLMQPSDGDLTQAETAPSGTKASRTKPVGIPRRVRVWWALTIVLASALTASATYALTSLAPVSVSNGAEQIASLESIGTATLPTGWMGAGPSSLAYEFFGLTLFRTAGGFTGPGTDCFAVVATDQLPDADADQNGWSMDGNIYSGCRVGSFPATVQLLVDSGAPKELSERYPTGSALQFVLDGDRVGVFLDSR